MNENPEDMLARATPESIAAWSDDKKKQFCELFAQRVKASRYILRGIAHRVVNKTRTSFMLGQRKASELEGQFSSRHDFFDVQDNGRGYHHRLNTIGGRDYSELCEVIEERTKEIVRNLPPVVQAIEVIDKVTAERMRQRDDLVKECEELRDQLTEVCEPVSMKSIAETHPKTTLLEFLSMLDTKEQNRQRLVATITSKMTEGVRLESEISKAMYKGLPGLSEAIVEVVNGMLEQDKALDMASRRVQERIQFGDSKEALGILRHFEADEVRLKSSVLDQFKKAIGAFGIPSKPGGSKKRKGGARETA